jgi:TM2 domain-containing membrane protein YozV
MRRTNDPAVIEHRLLELAYTTDAKITAPVLAYFAPCSIEDAEKVLDNLAARDRIEMEVDDDGTVIYHVPDRQKLPAHPPQPMAMQIVKPAVPLALRGGHMASPGLSALLSLLLPGAGQVYTGRFVSGLLWFLAVSAGYTLLIPGLILHMFCIASAATSAHRLNGEILQHQLTSGA